MTDTKHIPESPIVSELRVDSDVSSKDNAANSQPELTLARRGNVVDNSVGDVDGFDAERMRDRALLNADEEKALMRRIDWRLMTVCSIIFLIKNLDSENISNARIMNRGTKMNILTQLKMTADEYNYLTILYYVCSMILTSTGDPIANS